MSSILDVINSEVSSRAFERRVAGLIRSDEHRAAEALLIQHLRATRSEFADICMSLPLEAVSVQGWDEFNTQIEVISTRPAGQRGSTGPVTAVGIDISDQGDAVDAEGRREQTLETSYYTDGSAFRFSEASRRDLLEASEKNRAPWVGGFAEIDGSLTIHGLAPLTDALLHKPELQWSYLRTEEERHENVGSILGACFRHLRVHQAIKRELDAQGLARNIPVLVGTNEAGPYFTAVYYPPKTRDFRARAGERQEATRQANLAHYAKITEDRIATWREQRDAIRSWNPRINPDQRLRYVEFAEASEKLDRMNTPVASFGPGHKLSDSEFELMVQTYRHHRDPNAPAPRPAPAPALPPASPSRGLFGFGRRGL